MNNAGRIGFLIRGEYNDTETYDFLDIVFYDSASYVAKKTTAGNIPVRNNEYWQIFAEGGTLTQNGDVSETIAVFDTAENRVNIESGEKTGSIFSKIRKWFSDLKPHAFVSPVDNLLATVKGMALDASVGPAIDKRITANANAISQLNSDFENSGLPSIAKINDNFTFYDLLSRQIVTFFTNWTDSENFPEIYGSGILIPSLDSSVSFIVYTAIGGLYFGSCSNLHPFAWEKL